VLQKLQLLERSFDIAREFIHFNKPTPPKLEIFAEDLQGGASPSPKVGNRPTSRHYNFMIAIRLHSLNIFLKSEKI
jgi:hypothetical protein